MPATGARTFDSNWKPFPITVSLTLARLDEPGLPTLPLARPLVGSSRSTGGGSISRTRLVHGRARRFLYDAWGITYELFWIHTIDPTFLTVTSSQKPSKESALLTEHLISPNGVLIMGRSLCYRTAVPAPVIAESFFDPSEERGAGGTACALGR